MSKAKIQENKEEIKDLEKQIKKAKEVKQRVKVVNLQDRGDNVQFIYQNKFYDIKDGSEVVLKKEVVDHLNSVVLKQTSSIRKEDEELIKEYKYHNRVLCTVLENIEE